MEAGLWFIFLFGIAIGVLLTFLWFLRLNYGTIRIDHSDPEKDIYRLDIDTLDDLIKRKYILLKVDPDADLSQR